MQGVRLIRGPLHTYWFDFVEQNSGNIRYPLGNKDGEDGSELLMWRNLATW